MPKWLTDQLGYLALSHLDVNGTKAEKLGECFRKLSSWSDACLISEDSKQPQLDVTKITSVCYVNVR